MKSRRLFIKNICQGAAFSTLGFTPSVNYASNSACRGAADPKPVRIGIIGAENSHTAAFGKLFNIDKLFPGVEVKYVWGETQSYAKDAMAIGGIPNMVTDPMEMLGKIDALIVDHRHGKYHLEAALPFVEKSIPTFIDKPFCYRFEEGREFLALARKMGTPVTSFSSVAHSYDTFDIKEQVERMGEINQVIRYGPVDLYSDYGGVFFYGPHMIEPLLYIFGDDVRKVQVQKNDRNSSASMVFGNGMLATLVFTTKKYGWQTFVETTNGIEEIRSRLENKIPAKNEVDMVSMFRTGKEPRSHQGILRGVAVLEAMERSVDSGQWENVVTVNL